MSPEPIAHNRPYITTEDADAVQHVLNSGWIAPGFQKQALEADFTAHYKGGAAFAVSSGTNALFLGLVGLEVPPGCWIAVPTYSCSALLDAVQLAGCRAMVIDVDANNLTMSVPDLRATQKRLGPAAAAIVVHQYGAEAAVSELRDCTPFLIEDCCHSIGGTGQFGADGSFGQVAVHSFYATKPVAGGLGGLARSDDESAAGNMRRYLDQTAESDRWARVDMRVSDIHAALARSQLARLEVTRRRRAEIAERYLAVCPEQFAPSWLEPGRVAAGGRMVYRFVLRCPDGGSRERWLQKFLAAGVTADRLPQVPALLHRVKGLNPDLFPNAEHIVGRTLSLPIYPALTDEEVERICAVLSDLHEI